MYLNRHTVCWSTAVPNNWLHLLPIILLIFSDHGMCINTENYKPLLYYSLIRQINAKTGKKTRRLPPPTSLLFISFFLLSSLNLCEWRWNWSWQNQQNDVCTAKTQISLGICPVWSESWLCSLRISKDLRLFHADSGLRSEFAGCTSFCWFCHAGSFMWTEDHVEYMRG